MGKEDNELPARAIVAAVHLVPTRVRQEITEWE